MTLLQAIILGIIQGVTEFLPVSSSGHLALAQSIFDDFEQPGLLYDVLLHIATMAAVLIFFRARIKQLLLAILGFFSAKYNMHHYEEKSFLLGIIIATIPTGVIGYLLKDHAEIIFKKPAVIGYCMIITSLMLFLADRPTKGGSITPLKALIVGISQGLAVFPGISRSGTTIFTGLKAGISRQNAAEFSFIISIPAILGATLLHIREIGTVSVSEWSIYITGMIVAFICGLLAIKVMVSAVKKAKLSFFAIYCLIVGIVAIIWL